MNPTDADLMRLNPARRRRLQQIRAELARLTGDANPDSPNGQLQQAKNTNNARLINQLHTEATRLEQQIAQAAPLLRRQGGRA